MIPTRFWVLVVDEVVELQDDPRRLDPSGEEVAVAAEPADGEVGTAQHSSNRRSALSDRSSITPREERFRNLAATSADASMSTERCPRRRRAALQSNSRYVFGAMIRDSECQLLRDVSALADADARVSRDTVEAIQPAEVGGSRGTPPSASTRTSPTGSPGVILFHNPSHDPERAVRDDNDLVGAGGRRGLAGDERVAEFQRRGDAVRRDGKDAGRLAVKVRRRRNVLRRAVRSVGDQSS